MDWRSPGDDGACQNLGTQLDRRVRPMRTLLRTVLAICLLVLFAAAVDGQKPQPAAQPTPCVPRFQLFQGRIGIEPGSAGGGLARDVIVRLDTETGSAWVYSGGFDS